MQGKAVFANGVVVSGTDIDLGVGQITASNIIYSITGGEGLSITSGQIPSITNTGLLTIQGKTGKVALEAGDGITIDGLTISAKDSINSTQNLFESIAISNR